jgi:nuclear transport factor 2 (NTF2) superfamily protein
MITAENPRPPFPPFDAESAAKKVRLAEDAETGQTGYWNPNSAHRTSGAETYYHFEFTV